VRVDEQRPARRVVAWSRGPPTCVVSSICPTATSESCCTERAQPFDSISRAFTRPRQVDRRVPPPPIRRARLAHAGSTVNSVVSPCIRWRACPTRGLRRR
jgi:hypothetical protein